MPFERDRAKVDPENRYPSEGLRIVERHTLRIVLALPGATLERTRDAVQIDWGGEQGVVLLATPEALELRLPTTEWTMGAYGPSSASRLWRRVPWDELEGDAVLRGWIQKARKARRRQYRTCRYCGGSFPLEHMFRKDVCHGCASAREGVVY